MCWCQYMCGCRFLFILVSVARNSVVAKSIYIFTLSIKALKRIDEVERQSQLCLPRDLATHGIDFIF